MAASGLNPNTAGSVPDPQSTIGLQILLRNGKFCTHPSAEEPAPTDSPEGVWIKKRFRIPQSSRENCLIHGHREYYAVELTHKCRARQLLYEELAHLIPTLVRGDNLCWFRTMNKEFNGAVSCLFEGAQLELNVSSSYVPEFGFCFPRASFIAERERFDLNAIIAEEPNGDWIGWQHREPSDADRLRVNRKGWEVLYFLRAPPTNFDVTTSDLKSELCHTLQIEDQRRIELAAGPFYWDNSFKEDGLGLYSTYFAVDHVIDGRHMKTAAGNALVDVFEVTNLVHPS